MCASGKNPSGKVPESNTVGDSVLKSGLKEVKHISSYGAFLFRPFNMQLCISLIVELL